MGTLLDHYEAVYLYFSQYIGHFLNLIDDQMTPVKTLNSVVFGVGSTTEVSTFYSTVYAHTFGK